MKKLLASLAALAFVVTAYAAEEPKAKEVTATGEVLCAHCDLSVKTSCQNAVKTSDGVVYLLTGDKTTKFFKKHKDAKKVVVTGTTKADGKNTEMEVTAIKVAEEKKEG
jgi:hypothetical protein